MKRKGFRWLAIASILLLTITINATNEASAQTQGTTNLLVNPGFEAGHHHQDGISEITVPDGWRLHWMDGEGFPGSDGPAARPESVVWFIGDAPLEERSLFFRDGSYALKVFKGGWPMYAALSQDVHGLEVGRRYRLVAPVYVDIVTSYTQAGKVAPDNLDAGQVRLGAGPLGAPWLDLGSIGYSGFWTAATVNPFYLAYPIFVYDFTATHADMTVYIEFGSKGKYANNGFFLDTIGLYALDEVAPAPPSVPNPAPPSGPAPTPFPTPTPRADGAIIHVVQVGDTFWSLAIRYAPALGVTPEEALETIREINGNPAFLVVGTEVIISEAQEVTAAALGESEALVAEGGEETAEEEAEDETPEPTVEPTEVVQEPTAVPAEPTPVEELSNSICVSAFDDENGDGAPGAGEGLLSDAIFTISRPSGTVATYVSDGINEPYCFNELEADTYQIAFSQPPEYSLTTIANWAIAIAGGSEIPVQFGAQMTAADDSAAEKAAVAEIPEVEGDEGGDDGESSSPFGNIGLIVAIAVVLLAGVGVVLLRRG